jgi:hypothetical protein
MDFRAGAKSCDEAVDFVCECAVCEVGAEEW